MSAAWKPLALCPKIEMGKQIAAIFAELLPSAGPIHTDYPRMGLAPSLVDETGANICFLDVASNPEHAQMLIAEFSALIPVVALHHRNDADLILRCLRRGACEYLADPTAEAVRAVFERLGRARTSSGRPPGAIYCVVPGKPGCGASSLATQLAVQFRAPDSKVLLVDADPLNASVAFMLKLKSEFHFGDVVRDWQKMDDDLWGRLIVTACGVDIVTAPENAATAIEVSPAVAGEICRWWRDRYAVTVLDLPDVRTAADCGFAALADAVLLVTTNELAALQSTRRALGFLDHTTSDRSKLRLVLNRYTPATGLKRDDVRTALGLETFAMLSNDYGVMQTALLDGTPAPAGSRFATSVQALCLELQNKPAPAKAQKSWLSSLFRR